MLNKGYWAHFAPDGTSPWSFFTKFGYKYKYAGENLARDFSNPGSVVNAWMASSSHRENLLSPKYKEIGIAVVEGKLNGVDTTLVVQLFGTRLSVASVALVEPVVASEVSPVSSQPSFTLSQGPLGLSNSGQPKVSPFSLNQKVSLAIVTIILLALITDGLFVSQRKIARIGGRTLAHLSFFLTIMAIILIAKVGRVL